MYDDYSDEEKLILMKNKIRRKYKHSISIDEIDDILAGDGWDELYE